MVIQHKPVKLHLAPDAMSRHPLETIYETEDEVEISSSEILAGIRLPDSESIIASHQAGDNFQAVNVDHVKEDTLKDKINLLYLNWFSGD